MSSQNAYEQDIVNKLTKYRPLRTQRYANVNVLIITWKDHDFDPPFAFDQEIADVKAMFQETFNYTIWPVKIPTKNPERSLNLAVAQFVSNFGGEDDLLILFYSGHGGGDSEKRSSCTWAAKVCGGPTLDWSNIQPQLFFSSGDVVIILDCCYAGQAARPHRSNRIEFLAATDKDNWTPTGMQKWPSFTKVLLREMRTLMSAEGAVTLAALQRRMVVEESGLKRQPFMVAMAGDMSEGPIRLAKLTQSDKSKDLAPQSSSHSINAIYLRLCLFNPLDEATSSTLLRWLTRDSPASVEDIQVIEEALTQAHDVVKMEEKVFASAIEHGRTKTFRSISLEGQNEVQRLLRELKLAVSSSCDALSTTSGSPSVINGLRGASSRLTDFMADFLPMMDKSTLVDLSHDDAVTLEDIRNKILMRLTLLDDQELTGSSIRVIFNDQASSHQRIRLGRQADQDVLVEYIYYDKGNPDAFNRLSYQIRRMMALLVESSNPMFRSLGGTGFIHEKLCGPRFGIVHPLTESLSGRKFAVLAKLIEETKYVPLDCRIRLAAHICEAVLHLHSVGWYHKNIKIENIIVPSSSKSTSPTNWDFENPFIIGFDCSRPTDAETRDTVDFNPANNIYRHPDRWGRSTRFKKHHDIYSLGILILEIGCWVKFPSIDTKRESFVHVSDPEELRRLLLKVASSKLAHAAGARYADAVRNCIMRRKWEDLDDWESQKLVRETVLDQLR